MTEETNAPDTAPADAPASEATPEAPETVVKQDKADAGLILGKFKTAEDIIEPYKKQAATIDKLSKENKELKSKTPQAPEAYDLDFSKDEELAKMLHGLVPEEKLAEALNYGEKPLAKELAEVAKEAGLSQEQFGKLARAFAAREIADMPRPEKIREELGENAEAIIAEVSDGLAKYFTPESVEMLKVLGVSAFGVKALHEVVQKLQPQRVPAGAVAADSASSLQARVEELYSKINDNSLPYMVRDGYKKEYDRLSAELANMQWKKLG
jgi:hypothetical protein